MSMPVFIGALAENLEIPLFGPFIYIKPVCGVEMFFSGDITGAQLISIKVQR